MKKVFLILLSCVYMFAWQVTDKNGNPKVYLDGSDNFVVNKALHTNKICDVNGQNCFGVINNSTARCIIQTKSEQCIYYEPCNCTKKGCDTCAREGHQTATVITCPNGLELSSNFGVCANNEEGFTKGENGKIDTDYVRAGDIEKAYEDDGYSLNDGSGGFGAAAYDSGWFTMKSNDGDNSFKEISHNLGQLPSRVKVLVKAVNGANEGFVFEASGVMSSDDDREYQNAGGVVFAYNENKVRIWAPTSPDNSDYNNKAFRRIITIKDGWGNGKYNQSSSTAKVRVLVWR